MGIPGWALHNKKSDSGTNMQRYIMPDISIYQIQLFLTVAEERNFSRAANIMNMTQPTLSKRISALENAIGLSLFYREKRPVQLTPEGEILYNQWKSICSQFKNSINNAFKILKKRTHTLRVCWFDSGNMVSALSLVGKQLTQSYPGLAFHLIYSPFMKWRSLFIKGEIDIMITIKMESEYLGDELDWTEMTTCPKLVCMLDTNPLSQKDRITYEDLKDQKFIMLSPIETPIYQEFVRRICRQNGFDPIISRYAPNANSLISSLQDNNDVLICDKFLRNIDNPVIKCFELPNTYSGLIAVWKKENINPYIDHYIELLKQYYDSR